MEHVSTGALTHLFALLTASEIACITSTCRSLRPHELAVRTAIEQLVMRRFGDVLPFLRHDDALWPRTPLTLRCGEALRVKHVLTTALLSSEPAQGHCCSGHGSPVILARAWTVAWKKRCQAYDHYIQQFRITRKKQQKLRHASSLNDTKKTKKKTTTTTTTMTAVDQQQQAQLLPTFFEDSEKEATRDASKMIVCAHAHLLPRALCVARARRVTVSRSAFHVLTLYATDVRGFPADSTSDCIDCLHEQDEANRQAERERQDRFEEQIAGSTELVDLLLRKNGYPNELFSPASTRGNTLLSLQHVNSRSFYLVPKKWIVQWRKYVRSEADDEPGPVLNAELVCHAHQRNIVPAYITMFLSGFSLESSLQATQALGASSSTQYEIVTAGEWEALFDRYCAEYAVGFDLLAGAYHWKTPECHVCHYGMGDNSRSGRRHGGNASRR